MKEQVVDEWFERGKHDLSAAKILLREEEYFDVAVFHKNFGKVLSNDGYGAPYPDTPSRGVTRVIRLLRNI